jgi:hypothetical protein
MFYHCLLGVEPNRSSGIGRIFLTSDCSSIDKQLDRMDKKAVDAGLEQPEGFLPVIIPNSSIGGSLNLKELVKKVKTVGLLEF